MSEPEYFKNALSSFAFETACGGAIRHLADLGYTVKQITKQLDFPTSYEQVQKTVWTRLVDTGVICLSQPGSGKTSEKTEFVKEYDKYGKVSFRKVSLPSPDTEPIRFKESHFDPKDDFASFLKEKCSQNGQDNSYVSCNWGLLKEIQLQECLQVLDEKQQEYLAGLPWVKQLCYHRLDLRMQKIMIRLYENKKYQGTCFFLETKEKIYLC